MQRATCNSLGSAPDPAGFGRHHRVDDDRRTVIQNPCRVIAQNDGIGDALGMPADPLQRENVVAIQTGV